MNKEQDRARKDKAYDLRLRGRSYQQIADELGIGKGTAFRWVQEVCDEVTLPNVESVRKQEVDRLMRYLDVLDARIEMGDDKAVGLAIKVSERLTKMLGVDLPTVSVVETRETTQVDLAIQDLLNRQAAQNALRREAASHLRTDDLSDDTLSDEG